MNASNGEQSIFSQLIPSDILLLLESRGWVEIQRSNNSVYLEKGDLEVLVPTSTSLHDFPLRMAEVMGALQETERKSIPDLLEELSFLGSDVVRSRIPGTPPDGSITIEQGSAIHQHARELVLAAACAAIEPKPLFARRKPEEAMRFLSRARLARPSKGSYIMNIVCPFPAVEPIHRDLFGHADIPAEPFARKTVRILAEGLNAIARACEGAAQREKAIIDATASGVSANLCEAIVGLNESGGDMGLDFNFTWARMPLHPVPPYSRITLSKEAMPSITEAARLIRENVPVENVEVIGTVQKLEHIAADQGWVAIFGMVDEIQRTVYVQLSGEDHLNATQAYRTRAIVGCSGRLVKEGRSWTLKTPGSLSIISSE